MSDSVPDAPTDAAPTFADLGLDPRVLQSVSDLGYETPTPVQATTIPVLLEGRDVVGLAQTGTGKTAAFALPILSRIDPSRREPQALVLAPTRELALQVAEAFTRYAAHLPGINVVPIYGGQSYGVQLSALRRGAHVVVGTPGRVIDHLDRKTLDVSTIDHLVLDEADEMLTMGFSEAVERILSDTPDSKQVALFSATMPPAIRKISQQYLHDPQEIRVRTTTVTAANTRQRFLIVTYARKVDALARILEVEDFDAMIVFVRTKQVTEEVAERLRDRGFNAAAINGDLVQAQRERTIDALKKGKLDILVATDVAARGLDVDRISHVVNFDIPNDTESYIHRIGRTGRAGRSGEALLFVTPRERRLLGAIEKATRQPLTEMGLPSTEDVNARRVAKFRERITASLRGPDAAFFAEMVESYAIEHDLTTTEVAAALAVMAQGDTPLLAKPEPPAKRRARDDAPPRDDRPRARVAGHKREAPGAGLATYRIQVGKRHKINPGAIVGAIANEGGLSRRDFGKIDIRADHSLVELPSELSGETMSALARTRISGQLIHLEPDSGPPARRAGARVSSHAKRAPDGKKFRHKP